MAATKVTPSTDNAQEIQRLLGTAQEVGRADHYSGKRGHTRFSAGMQLEVTTDPKTPGTSQHVVMQNLSGSGLAFWCKRELRQHSVVFVREFGEDGKNEWVAAEVQHCTAGLRGYLVGAEFGNPTPGNAPSQTAPR